MSSFSFGRPPEHSCQVRRQISQLLYWGKLLTVHSTPRVVSRYMLRQVPTVKPELLTTSVNWSEARDVVAEIREEAQETTQYDFAIDRVVFNINGRAGTSQPSQPSQPAAVTNTITIVPSSIDGEPGEEIEFTVISSPAAVVVLDSGDLDDGDFSPLFGSPSGTFTVDLTLPDEEGSMTSPPTAPGYPTTDSNCYGRE